MQICVTKMFRAHVLYVDLITQQRLLVSRTKWRQRRLKEKLGIIWVCVWVEPCLLSGSPTVKWQGAMFLQRMSQTTEDMSGWRQGQTLAECQGWCHLCPNYQLHQRTLGGSLAAESHVSFRHKLVISVGANSNTWTDMNNLGQENTWATLWVKLPGFVTHIPVLLLLAFPEEPSAERCVTAVKFERWS